MSDIKIGRMVVGIYATNSYFLYRADSKEVVVVDVPDEGRMIAYKLAQYGFKVVGILLTHGHFDHIWGVSELRSATSAKVYAYEKEETIMDSPRLNVSERMHRPVRLKVNKYLADGDEVELAGIKFKMLATPGHTRGSCCYYVEEAGFLVSGDTLFLESVGRNDFPTGSATDMKRSIKEKLFVLPDDTKVYPGHGDETTIGHEKKYNPFLV